MTNPWLAISAEDYEAHMASPEVGQHQRTRLQDGRSLGYTDVVKAESQAGKLAS